MKKLIFSFLVFSSFACFAQTPLQVANQSAFAKLYGYLKYFYPGDEAAKINWDKFAIYGAEKVDACKTPAELKDSLQALIYPLMPGVQVAKTSEQLLFNKNLLTPAKLSGFEIITWQHVGVGLQKDPRSPYASARTNRPRIFDSQPGFGPLSTSINATGFEGKDFVFSGKAKMLNGTGNGRLWLRVDKTKGVGFFNNMEQNPIRTKEWTVFTIEGKIDADAAKIVFGAFLLENGEFAFDDISLRIKEGDVFKEVYSNSFENEIVNKAPKSLVGGIGSGNAGASSYNFDVRDDKGNKYIVISSPAAPHHTSLFKAYPKFGEYIEKDLGQGLKALIPIALYGTKTNTFPAVADTARLAQIVSRVNNLPAANLTANSLYTRIGNLINAWNVLQHFYPYFDVAKTDWHQDLKQALGETYLDKNTTDFSKTLKKLTAKLKDGHVFVSFPDPDSYMPPFAWKWVENQLVITSVLDSSTALKVGSLVIKINGENPQTYFENVQQYISAATKGWMDYRAQTESLPSGKDSKLVLTVKDQNNQIQNIELSRSLTRQVYNSLLPKQDTIKALSSDITYISISNASMKAINDALPVLQKSKAIICDLRGYPRDNVGLITYLMTKDDTSSQWMQIPQILYPDQEKISGYHPEKWGLKPGKTHLNAKIYFLIDGQAISYAESYMSFIEHYKLATIIGQPTAGTNGNVNRIILPGGFSISFTGMKVYKHDGSQHHGIGITPNIYVEQTIKGIRENRDEILERAILEASKD